MKRKKIRKLILDEDYTSETKYYKLISFLFKYYPDILDEYELQDREDIVYG